MFLTAHATAGVIIAQVVPNPWIAFVLGFLSHYVLDAIPHGDDELLDHLDGKAKIKTLTKMALIDFAVALTWLAVLFNQNKNLYTPAAAAAIAGSVLPDFLNGVYLVTKHKLIRWNHRINVRSHSWLIKKPLPAWQGFIVQSIFFIAMASYLWLQF